MSPEKVLTFLALAGLTSAAVGAAGPKMRVVGSIDASKGIIAYEQSHFHDRTRIDDCTFLGEKCLRVTCVDKETKDQDTAWRLSSGLFKVSPKKAFAVNIRSAGTRNMAMNYGGSRLQWYTEDKKKLQTIDQLARPIDDCESLPFTCRAQNWCETVTRGFVPQEACYGEITLGGDNPNLGCTEHVDIAFANYYEAVNEKDLVFTGDFDPPVLSRIKPSKPCADFKAPILFQFTDVSGLDEAKLEVKLDGVSIKDKIEKLDFPDGYFVYKYKPAEPWEEYSLHRLDFSAADTQGNEMSEERFVYFTKEKIKHSYYTVRDDGMILRDGKPIFPISIFAYGGDVADMKTNGFTVISTYMARYNWAGKEGILDRVIPDLTEANYPIVMPNHPDDQYDEAGIKWRDEIITTGSIWGRDQGCMAAWELGDDTASHRTPWQVRRDHLMCHAIDDGILTSQTDGCTKRGRYYEYTDATDIFRIELYPFRAEEPEPDAMARFKRDIENAYFDLKRSGIKNRSIWAVPQAFMGWKLWKRFPTFEEMRAETFMSIAMRTRGLAYYTYKSGDWGAKAQPETWAQLTQITREVNALIPDLISYDAEEQPKAEVVSGPKVDECCNFPIGFLLKSTGLFIACNSSSQPVTAEFKFPNGKKLTHAFERNGVFIERVE